MRIVIARNEETLSVNFSGSFSEAEMNDVKFTQMERALLQDLGRPKQRGSDYLLALELLFRRYEEQHPETAGMAPFKKD